MSSALLKGVALAGIRDMLQIFPPRDLIEFVDDRRYAIDSTKIRQEPGWIFAGFLTPGACTGLIRALLQRPDSSVGRAED